MLSKQKGFIPSATFVIGIFGTGYLYLVFWRVAIELFSGGHFTGSVYFTIYKILVLLLVFFTITLFGFSTIYLFPSIKLSNSGVKVQRFLSIQVIGWDEIEEIVSLNWPKKALAVVIKPKEPILKSILRLNLSYLHGMLFQVFQPIIIFSKGLENRELILNEIKKHNNSINTLQRIQYS